jgi:hypothetical protein
MEGFPSMPLAMGAWRQGREKIPLILLNNRNPGFHGQAWVLWAGVDVPDTWHPQVFGAEPAAGAAYAFLIDRVGDIVPDSALGALGRAARKRQFVELLFYEHCAG